LERRSTRASPLGYERFGETFDDRLAYAVEVYDQAAEA
jgi:hypothetical protein